MIAMLISLVCVGAFFALAFIASASLLFWLLVTGRIGVGAVVDPWPWGRREH